MGKKAVKKKKAYKFAVREQVRKGLINNEDGEWKVPTDRNSAMARDQYNGYRFNR